MALTGSERVKRWREKNRALYNLRRKGYRKKDLSGGIKPVNEVAVVAEPARAAQLPEVTVSSGKFPKMITLSSPVKAEEPLAPPAVYRDDYGRVITKGQWEKLQNIKEKAKDGGYEIDGFSQI